MALTYGGFKAIPVKRDETTEKYMCPFCKDVLRTPVQTGCGERFCSSCFTHLISQVPPKCPVCHELLSDSEVFKDAFAEREIRQLVVFCQQKDEGCPWQGKLFLLHEHDLECDFLPRSCRNPGCTVLVSTQRWERHNRMECNFRRVKCDFCEEEILSGQVENHLKTKCSKAPMQCPNSCGVEPFPRMELEKHIDFCPKALLPCPFHLQNCSFQGTREELNRHINAKLPQHMEYVNRSQARFMQENADQARQIALLTESMASMRESMTKMSLLVSGLEARFLRFQPSVVGAPSDRAAHGFDRVEHDLQQIRTDVTLARQTADEARAATRRAQGNIDEILLPVQNQHEQRINNCDKSIAMQDLNMSDLSLRVDILDVKVFDGVLVWKICDFARRLNDARSGKTPSLYSAPFYTSPCGYKMCARVYLDGDGIGKSTHISLFFVLMRGEYDALLQWPFNLKVTIMLLDQSGGASQKRHIVETFRPDIR